MKRGQSEAWDASRLSEETSTQALDFFSKELLLELKMR